MTDLSETPGSGFLDPQVIAGSLNSSCFCISLDRAELVKVFQATPETRTVLSAMGSRTTLHGCSWSALGPRRSKQPKPIRCGRGG